MMKSFLPSHKQTDYASVVWYKSESVPGVTFGVRRPSLAQRIDLTERVRELSIKHEFLKAGDVTDQLEAALSELLVRKLYLEWGLAELKGLKINGQSATLSTLIESGPEALTEEVMGAVLAEAGLTDDERKNF